MPPLTLLILAAGMGSRYGGLKQVAPVNPCGEAILDYSIFDALRAGFTKVIFVIHPNTATLFKTTIGVRFTQHLEVAYALQSLDTLPNPFTAPPARTKPWGTLHAALAAAPLIHSPFAVINADDFYGTASFQTLARHLQHSIEYAMVGFPLRATLSAHGPVSRALCTVDPTGLLRGTVEHTHIVSQGNGAISTQPGQPPTFLSGDEIVSMNMWGFTPNIFPQLQQSFRDFLALHSNSLTAEAYLPAAINQIASSGQTPIQTPGQMPIHVLPANAQWCGITYPEDYPHVVQTIHTLTHQGHYPERLWP